MCVWLCDRERERELGVASDRGEKRSKVQRHHVSGGNLTSPPPPHKGGLRCCADDDGDD